MALRDFRRDRVSKAIFRWAKSALPSMSETERAAVEAGEVWWDAELFRGTPDWRKLLETPPARVSEAERAFLEGPVHDLCAMLDDWRITWELGDLPQEVWAFMREKRFFGMIIPERYGGLGFSAYAHSEVVRTLSTRSLVAAVTAMVPNSLGPAELLLQFGTDAQRDHWLPRLADGREIPCFALTSAEAGSDAASMTDRGVVCRGLHQGEEVLGIRLDWRKRYITLCPVATVLGLAFKLYDPDRLLGGQEDLGITVALVPMSTPGVIAGRRHLPAFQFFQNGPTEGRDVFITLDQVIGGREQLGQGWKMLMSALAAGRGISLPSLAAASAAFAARATGAYARVRYQFGLPIGAFEGVQERLGRIAATAYLLDAARRLTCAGLDEGRKLAVISAIVKAHATERMREALSDAMDVHAGKTVVDGPLNYLGGAYRAVPVGITVEGANILTRSFMIFGQGAIRCHPYLLAEMRALAEPDARRGLEAFDAVFWRHVGHSIKTLFVAWGRSWSGGRFAPAPEAGMATAFYRQLSRYAAAFALVADIALLTMGGALKRKEAISARLGDILSELYLLSAVAKRWHDEGRQEADLPLLQWSMEEGFARIERAFDGVLANMPSRAAAGFLRFVLPASRRRRGPSDRLTQRCALILMAPSATRERLTQGLFLGTEGDGVARLERAFTLVVETEPIRKRLKDARLDWREAEDSGAITRQDAARMAAAEEAIAAVVEVDDFDAEELGGARPRRRRAAKPSRPSAGPVHPEEAAADP